MSQNNDPSSSNGKPSPSKFIGRKRNVLIMEEPNHIFRDTLEFKILNLYWRLKALPENKQICRSPTLHVPTNPPTKWSFIIMKNHQQSGITYFSARFMLESSRSETCAGKLQILDKSGNQLASVNFSGVFTTTNMIASIYNTSANILLPSLATDMVNEDLFTLRCELEVLQEGVYFPCKTIDSTENNSLQIDWKNLWSTIDIDDVVTFQLADGEYRAHKSILTARSPVFAAMFKQDAKEKLTSKVIIEDLDKHTLHTLLEFIYTGKAAEADVNEQTVASLLMAADKYMLPELKEKCENVLIPTVSEETCVEYLKLADLFSCARLKSQVLRFLSSEISKQVASPDFWDKLHEAKVVRCLADLAIKK